MMKLSYKFLMVVVLSFLGSVLLFYILFANRYRAMDFYIANYTDLKSPAEQIDDMQKKITETRISRKDKKAILELMKQYPSLSMQLYSNDREYIADHILSDEGISINTRSVWVELYYPEEKDFQLKFYDGDCYLIVQSYQGMTFIMIYLFVSSTIALGLFFSITIHFVRKKMKYVLRLENEMKLIESGDLQHQIECVGNDEIGSLATQLDHLRVALKENMEKESEARKANEELITTMSHDLRTPLTSLMGYLDILEMKIYKNEADHDAYIEKCKQKAEQIKTMSARLFTHFFVYAQDDDILLVDIPTQQIKETLSNCCLELMSSDFQVEETYCEEDGILQGDMGLIDRIFDNIFSNVIKYAQKEQVKVALFIEENKLHIQVKNQKKMNQFKEESTCIGTKSMDKMIRQMNGKIIINDEESTYCVECMIPLKK